MSKSGVSPLHENGPYLEFFWSVIFRIYIQSECGKIRTRKTSDTNTFYAVHIFNSFMSSSVYKVIRPVLNFFFFYDKISQALKSTKKH